MDSEQEQTRIASRIPWIWITLSVGLFIGFAFLWDMVSHPVHYFGYDPLPVIIDVFSQILRFTLYGTVAIFVFYLYNTFVSRSRLEGERRDLDNALQVVRVQGVSTRAEEPGRWVSDFQCDVVGESHYQNALDEICGGKSFEGHCEEVTATLVLDDGNPYDSNAVRVEIEGETVGYLSRETAIKFRKKYAKKKQPLKCPAIIRGGWDRGDGDVGHYGVKLGIEL